jgi:hypothetical protein
MDNHVDQSSNPISQDKYKSNVGILKDLEKIKRIESRIIYLQEILEKADKGKIIISETTKEVLYKKLAHEYLESPTPVTGEKGYYLSETFRIASKHFEEINDKDRGTLFRELSKDAASHSYNHERAHKTRYAGLQSRIGNRAVAVLLAGGLIFAMRAMTGHVTSSSTGVGGEIVGSVLIGLLLVGVVWMAVSRLTAKP